VRVLIRDLQNGNGASEKNQCFFFHFVIVTIIHKMNYQDLAKINLKVEKKLVSFYISSYMVKFRIEFKDLKF
jgi:hypothetical protein